MGGGIEETFAETDELLVFHLLHQRVDSHGGDELLVANRAAILQSHELLVCVDLFDCAVGAESGLLLWQGTGNSNPDATSASMSRETERSIRAPISCSLLEDDILGDILEIWCCNSLAQPRTLHLLDISRPIWHCCRILTFVVGTAHTL